MSAQEYRRIVAVDFDGTLAVTKFPEIIKPIPKMIRYCKQLQKSGAILILYTCRKGKDLQDAGSGACLRAAYRTGHNFLGFEIDKDYFTEADKRLREEMAQMRFDFLFGGYAET